MIAPLEHDLIYVSRVIPELARVAVDITTSLPDGTGEPAAVQSFAIIRDHVQHLLNDGSVTWAHIAQYALSDARTESAPEMLRMKVAYLAAVCVSWIDDSDRRSLTPAVPPTVPA